MKVLIADYGLNVWYGGLYDYEDRLSMLKALGYDGLERLEAKTENEVLSTAALARKMGMHFATVRGGTPAETLLWSAAMDKKYVWTESGNANLEIFCRQVNDQIASAEKYGITVGIHNHLGSPVETAEQLDYFMEHCPKAGLILDTGHLHGAGGDPMAALEKYYDRLVMVHVKDYEITDANASAWYQRLRFCELGAGAMGDVNMNVLKALVAKGYDKWLAVEHDTHLRDPRIDLKVSREYIAKAGI